MGGQSPAPPGVTFSARTKAGRADGAFKDAARRGRCQEAPGAPRGSAPAAAESGRPRPAPQPPPDAPRVVTCSFPTCSGGGWARAWGRGAPRRMGGAPGVGEPG